MVEQTYDLSKLYDEFSHDFFRRTDRTQAITKSVKSLKNKESQRYFHSLKETWIHEN